MRQIIFVLLISLCLSTQAMAVGTETGNPARVCVPEPGTLGLLGVGMGALAYVKRCRKKKRMSKEN